MRRLRVESARRAAIRVRAIRSGYVDFERTIRCLDRLERLGHRLNSSMINQVVIEVRDSVIEACSPGLRRYPAAHGAYPAGALPEDMTCGNRRVLRTNDASLDGKCVSR